MLGVAVVGLVLAVIPDPGHDQAIPPSLMVLNFDRSRVLDCNQRQKLKFRPLRES